MFFTGKVNDFWDPNAESQRSAQIYFPDFVQKIKHLLCLSAKLSMQIPIPFCDLRQCGNVTFLAAKKVTKEGGLRGHSEKACPLKKPLRAHRQPTPENVPIFGYLQVENLQVFWW